MFSTHTNNNNNNWTEGEKKKVRDITTIHTAIATKTQNQTQP